MILITIMDQQPNINNIEILKAASRQVIQDENAAHQMEVSTPSSGHVKTSSPPFHDETTAYDIQEIREYPRGKIKEEKNFVEELLHKLRTLAQEEQTMKKEKEQFDRMWADLEEKRQKLETRLAAISRVKGKLMALNQEVEDIIS